MKLIFVRCAYISRTTCRGVEVKETNSVVFNMNHPDLEMSFLRYVDVSTKIQAKSQDYLDFMSRLSQEVNPIENLEFDIVNTPCPSVQPQFYGLILFIKTCILSLYVLWYFGFKLQKNSRKSKQNLVFRSEYVSIIFRKLNNLHLFIQLVNV